MSQKYRVTLRPINLRILVTHNEPAAWPISCSHNSTSEQGLLLFFFYTYWSKSKLMFMKIDFHTLETEFSCKGNIF